MSEGNAYSDPRVLDRRRCVLRYLIDDFAASQPDAVYAVFEDGGQWT
jgi:crotonobetaine/carnitine-CoA ligase